MQPKTYTVAVRSYRANAVAPDWLDQLRGMEDVSVRGGTRDQAVVVAKPQAMDRVRAKLGGDFLIEEQKSRSI
jgi:hypothetical protein